MAMDAGDDAKRRSRAMTITLATRGALPFTAIGRADGWAAVPQSWRRFFALAGRDGPYASFAVENPFLDAARGGILAPSAFQAPMVRRLNSRLTGASRAHPEQNEVRRIIAETVVALGRRLGVTVVWKGSRDVGAEDAARGNAMPGGSRPPPQPAGETTCPAILPSADEQQPLNTFG